MTERNSFSVSNWLRSPGGIVLIVFLIIAGFYLLTEHTAHVFGVLPYALLLLCPLLHLLMHRGHGGEGGHEGHAGARGGSAPVSTGAPHQHGSEPM